VEKLPALKRAGETAAFGLRMNAGWPLVQFRSVTGFDSDRFRLTPDGLRFADAAAEMFLR
jgi:hypothetical protein